jgi:SNF2 family DNA or RNA helicase
MGLGKTITAIALLTALYTTKIELFNDNIEHGPTLIVCPATVIN